MYCCQSYALWGQASCDPKQLAIKNVKYTLEDGTDVGEVYLDGAQYCIYGKYASLADAKAVTGGTITGPNYTTAWDMTYSDELGYIIPTSVWKMLIADTSWYSADENEFDISTASQWYGLAKLIANETTAGSVTNGKTFNLTADIDLNPGFNADVSTIIPDGQTSRKAVFPAAPAKEAAGYSARFNYFAGTLNGNGHTVSGYYYRFNSSAGTSGGIIGTLDGGIVENVIFENGCVIGHL